MLSHVTIPKPCPVRAQALAPTEAGWHCARCATEVIDFTRLSEAEILAYLGAHQGQRVCAAMQVPLTPQPYQRPRGPRRWLLAVAAFLGWQSAGALPPQRPPSQSPLLKSANRHTRIIISGVVLNNLLNTPIPDAYVFIKGTKYGAITNERGEFSLSFYSDWELARTGKLLLAVSAGHVTFERQQVVVNFKDNLAPAQLVIRLLPLGFALGEIKSVTPPTHPPVTFKTQP